MRMESVLTAALFAGVLALAGVRLTAAQTAGVDPNAPAEEPTAACAIVLVGTDQAGVEQWRLRYGVSSCAAFVHGSLRVWHPPAAMIAVWLEEETQEADPCELVTVGAGETGLELWRLRVPVASCEGFVADSLRIWDRPGTTAAAWLERAGGPSG